MKEITCILLFAAGLLSTSGCDKFDELNVNPVSPTVVSPELLFSGSLRNGTLNWDIYQIGQNLHADQFVQYFANVNPGFQTDQYVSNPTGQLPFGIHTTRITLLTFRKLSA